MPNLADELRAAAADNQKTDEELFQYEVKQCADWMKMVSKNGKTSVGMTIESSIAKRVQEHFRNEGLKAELPDLSDYGSGLVRLDLSWGEKQ